MANTDPHPQPNDDNLMPTYVAYSDEAQFNFGRYRGVAAASVRREDCMRLTRELRDVVAAAGVLECKWEKVRSARMRFAAEHMLRWALDHAIDNTIGVDALTWDAGDDSAARAGLPHLTRLRQMYAHLFTDILPGRHPGATWAIHPDEQHALRWDTLARSLPHVASIESLSSAAEPLIQLADLFAGLAVFSRASFATYQRWLALPLDERDPSRALAGGVSARAFTASDRDRCYLLDSFYTGCKLSGQRVTLRTQGGLRTYGRAHPICFWWHGA